MEWITLIEELIEVKEKGGRDGLDTVFGRISEEVIITQRYKHKVENIIQIVKDEPNLTLTTIVKSETDRERYYKTRYEEETALISLEFDEQTSSAKRITIEDTRNNLLEAIEREKKKAIVNARQKNQPAISRMSIELADLDLADYLLPERIQIQAKIGYNPFDYYTKRLNSLIRFRDNSGRTNKQRWADRTLKKIDQRVIATLKSIARYEPYEKNVELARVMVDYYERYGSFIPGN